MRRRLLALLLTAALAPAAFAYYHFVHYTSSGVYVPVYDKFDVNALPNKTVSYFVTDSVTAGLSLAGGDSYTSVVSQIRSAASVWNTVSTADIRNQFGGIFTPGNVPGSKMNGPAIEIVFDDLPPGVLGRGGPVVRSTPTNGSSGTFEPIVVSQVVLPRNFAERPSWSESFFLTAVHEFGHALGLQHTFSSSVMSTEVTRGVTKARPLGADDRAGLSVLYPTQKFYDTMGSIAGRVTLVDNGQGVALASVVALSPGSDAVSAITAPDGTYRIDGLEPGFYYVYVHPLPPFPASGCSYGAQVNVCLPIEAGNPVQPGPPFDLLFYPDSKTPQQNLFVAPAQATAGIDFSVNRRSSVTLYDFQSYSSFTQYWVKPGYLLQSNPSGTITMTGMGAVSNRDVVPGLSASMVGGAEVLEPDGLHSYIYAPDWYFQVDIKMSPFAGEGPRHMLFSTPTERYVLPNAYCLVRQSPPNVQATVNPDNTLTLSGDSLSEESRVWFDGAQAVAQVTSDAQLIVTPPPGPAGHHAMITVLNPDGQSTLFTQGNSGPAYDYPQGNASSIAATPNAVPSGVETVVEISGFSTSFASNAQPGLAFGTSDATTQRLWVTAPDHMIANISVSPNALQTAATVTAVSGVQFTTLHEGFYLTGSGPRQLYVPFSTMTGFYAYPGSAATVPVVNGAGSFSSTGVTATLNDRAVQILGVNGNQVLFQVPGDQPLGPAILRMSISGEPVLPIAIPIDPLPPVIVSVTNSNGTSVDTNRSASPGDTLALLVANLADATANVDPSSLKVGGAGIDHQVIAANPSNLQPGLWVVYFTLSPETPRGIIASLTITYGNRVSPPFALALQDSNPNP